MPIDTDGKEPFWADSVAKAIQASRKSPIAKDTRRRNMREHCHLSPNFTNTDRFRAAARKNIGKAYAESKALRAAIDELHTKLPLAENPHAHLHPTGRG